MEEQLQQNDELVSSTQTPIEDVEWCFQFFNNEAVVFGYSIEGEPAGNLNIQLKPVEDEGMTFSNNGMEFKIFPRAITEETKKIRAKENEDKN